MSYRLGLDVGKTNTDAVILDNENHLISKIKVNTTDDINTGISNALEGILKKSSISPQEIKYVMLGTTHCTNAITKREGLAKVGIIRIGKPATLSIKPLLSWPEDLRKVIGGYAHIVRGGHEYDGRELSPLDEEEAKRAIKSLKRKKVESIAISSVFSPVNNEHELRVSELVKEIMGDEIPVSLSHRMGSIGLIERENATVLNAAIIKTAHLTFRSFENLLKKKEIDAEIYISQNDGTLMSMEYAMRYPILTIASGPVNSIRGGAFLSGVRDAIVVDIGGMETDMGVLVNGFPKESSVAVEIGGVITNFRMPELISIRIGGGSLIKEENGDIMIGPESVGNKLKKLAQVFGGDKLTATDIAVFLNKAEMGDPSRLKINRKFAENVDTKIKSIVKESIKKMSIDCSSVPVILVGGGSIILSDDLGKGFRVIRPEHFEVANAIGATIAQVSGEIDRVFSLEERGRENAIEEGRETAIKEAIKAGADPETVEVIDIEERPLAYLPGNAIRLRVKAVGCLKI